MLERNMTKLLDPVDSAATEGARKQAAQANASMLKVGSLNNPVSPKVEIKTKNETQGKKIVIRSKPGG
jgi:hypothetical protein